LSTSLNSNYIGNPSYVKEENECIDKGFQEDEFVDEEFQEDGFVDEEF
jgi:hypothetical protein